MYHDYTVHSTHHTGCLMSLILLCPVHAAVLQLHLSGTLWSTNGGEPPDSTVVSVCVHVSSGRFLWFSDGGPAGQQTGEVTLSFIMSHSVHAEK